MDNLLTSGRAEGGTAALQRCLERLRAGAVAANAGLAAQLGIPASAAVTCVKPSGTVSQLVDCGSGIHPHHSQVRRGGAGRQRAAGVEMRAGSQRPHPIIPTPQANSCSS